MTRPNSVPRSAVSNAAVARAHTAAFCGAADEDQMSAEQAGVVQQTVAGLDRKHGPAGHFRLVDSRRLRRGRGSAPGFGSTSAARSTSPPSASRAGATRATPVGGLGRRAGARRRIDDVRPASVRPPTAAARRR